jgi:transposase InsO family protein
MKQRNPIWGFPRIAQQITLAFGIPINRDVVRCILAARYQPKPGAAGPSWLTVLGHAKDSLWSLDLFRCESAVLHTLWVLVVMDQCTRRIVGFGVHRGTVGGGALCHMFNRAIGRQSAPTYLSSDHDPLYRFHQWQANLRILDVEAIKTVPYAPLSHPFVERLIGTIRRECLDRTLFWTAADLELKLLDFQRYFNGHRGSAREESAWRAILDSFEPAFQLGMIATPLRERNPRFIRLLRESALLLQPASGNRGWLPRSVPRASRDFRVGRPGWRPSQDDLDRYGRAIPDEEYSTQDFERVVALRARTDAIARHLTGFLKKSDRFAKTIVFCLDQKHASEMRAALNDLNADLVVQHPNYVCRMTADEGDIGRGHLGRFQDVAAPVPTILTASQLLHNRSRCPDLQEGSTCPYTDDRGRAN